MVHRDIEISLNLRRMQIERQHAARSRRLQQIRHQLRRNRHARPILPVLPRIRVIRNHRRNPPGRRALERVNHQQQLHQVEIHRMAARLHHEHIRAAHIFQNLIARFAVAELAVLGAPSRDAQIAANRVAERRVRCAAKNFELFVGQSQSQSFNRSHASRVPGHNFPWRQFRRRKPNLPEMHERLGAHALGFGRFRTPPTRYPPARHLRLLARAIRPGFPPGADDG